MKAYLANLKFEPTDPPRRDPVDNQPREVVPVLYVGGVLHGYRSVASGLPLKKTVAFYLLKEGGFLLSEELRDYNSYREHTYSTMEYTFVEYKGVALYVHGLSDYGDIDSAVVDAMIRSAGLRNRIPVNQDAEEWTEELFPDLPQELVDAMIIDYVDPSNPPRV